MAFLAGTFLCYCDEYESFRCFVNLVHDYYFPQFFEGVVADFKIRIDQFD